MFRFYNLPKIIKLFSGNWVNLSFAGRYIIWIRMDKCQNRHTLIYRETILFLCKANAFLCNRSIPAPNYKQIVICIRNLLLN